MATAGGSMKGLSGGELVLYNDSN